MSPEGFYSPYPIDVEDTRKTEYAHLGEAVYLDHAGVTPYAASVITRQAQALTTDLWGNPHSASSSGQRTHDKVSTIREQVLRFLQVEGYHLVFTSGTTASIKLVGELMQSFHHWHYCYANNSHTSLVGLRALATDWSVDEGKINAAGPLLNAWPARCNVTGAYKSSVPEVQGKDVYSLYDAASFVSTCPLDLTAESGPDFVALSFGKLFGYPTGLGALLVKQSDRIHRLIQQRAYFGGGTVEAVSSTDAFSAFKQSPADALEDGTLPFHSILALEHAISVHQECYGQACLRNIHRHVQCLAEYARHRLLALTHSNGRNLVQLFGAYRGSPIISMTLTRSNSQPIGYAEVGDLASLLDLHIRTGTLCNPGILTTLGFTGAEIQANHAAGHVCSDKRDVIDGRHTGAVRISLGAMSTLADIDAFVTFLQTYFCETTEKPRQVSIQTTAVLTKLNVYPIKSCRGFSVPAGQSWRVLSSGLEYDRQWAIINLETRQVLSQKRYTRMALIAPTITDKALEIQVGDEGKLRVPLDATQFSLRKLSCTVCGEKAQVLVYDCPVIEETLSNFLGIRCTLSIADPSAARSAKLDSAGSWSQLSAGDRQQQRVQLLLSNESPFLCIAEASVAAVAADAGLQVDAAVFRANFELSGLPAFAEDALVQMRLGSCAFAVLGQCRRCLMICINQETGQQTKEPYATLARMRKSKGRLWFGIHLALEAGTTIQVGDCKTG